MKIANLLFRNLSFVVSASAYIALSVPAEPKWILCGAGLIAAIYLISRFLPDIASFTAAHQSRTKVILSVILSLLLGFRFEKVWRYSSAAASIAQVLSMPKSVLLFAMGIIIGCTGISFALR